MFNLLLKSYSRFPIEIACIDMFYSKQLICSLNRLFNSHSRMCCSGHWFCRRRRLNRGHQHSVNDMNYPITGFNINGSHFRLVDCYAALLNVHIDRIAFNGFDLYPKVIHSPNFNCLRTKTQYLKFIVNHPNVS